MMEQKTKFIIIGLVVILIISLFISLQIYGAKQMLERKKDELQKENADLVKKIDLGRLDNKRLEDKLSALNRELDAIAREKDEVQRKYELADKKRRELVEQLESLQTRPVTAAGAQQGQPSLQATLPSTQDSYWGGILKAKTDLELQLANIRNELKTVQINNEQLQRDRATLELDAKNLSSEREDLKRQLEYNKKIMDSIASELVIERNDKFQIENSLKTLKTESNILRRQIKSLNNRKINLERKLADLQKENNRFEDRFAEMNTLLKDKMSQIDNLKSQLELSQVGEVSEQKKESVELPPIVVRPQVETTAQEAVPLVSKILAINKDNNFVIIDLGEDQGIRIGDIFEVYKEDKAIATIEVIQVRQKISACDIKKETVPIKVGDTVK